MPEQERLLIYFPLGTVTIVDPKVNEFYDDFCNHRATNLKADENEIVSDEDRFKHGKAINARADGPVTSVAVQGKDNHVQYLG